MLIANEIYFKLLNVCLKSICSLCNQNNIDKIFIADLGLNDKERNVLSSITKKIEFVKTDTVIPLSTKIYSNEWISAVSKKTQILFQLVNDNNLPIVMMDSDMIVTEDFSDVIDTDFDIQICKRSEVLFRPDNLVVEYIASFFIVNNQTGGSFISKWINRIEERIREGLLPPYETPAMVETLKNEKVLRVGFLEDRVVSSENVYIPNITKIAHAKGRDKKDNISIYRFTNIKKLPFSKSLYLFNGREKIYFFLSLFVKKIYNPYELKKKIKSTVKKIINNKK